MQDFPYDPTVTTMGLGLRELKKQITRESIADAALRLVADHGLERVTIDEIARLAFVSPRTFSNYFSCKEEAVVAAGERRMLAAIPEQWGAGSELPLRAVAHMFASTVENWSKDDLRLTAQQVRLATTYPSLRPYRFQQFGELQASLAASIASRPGTRIDYAQLIAAVAVAAFRTTVEQWATDGGDPGDLGMAIASAFASLERGLPWPEPTPSP